MDRSDSAGRRLSNAEPSASDEPILVVEGIKKSYGALDVLKGISFSVHRAEVLSIIGASGSGKSTLLRCVNRLESIDEGRILMDGKVVGYKQRKGKCVRERESEIRKYRAEVGMVFQQFNLFPHMTVMENIIEAPMVVRGMGKKEAVRKARELMAQVHLFQKEVSYPDQLSGGEQQRVAIARALIMNPKVMLFDEVTAALDPETVGEVLKTMEELANRGMTMIAVSHEMSFVREASDRVFFVWDGLIYEEGRPDEMLVHPRKEETKKFLSRLTVE